MGTIQVFLRNFSMYNNQRFYRNTILMLVFTQDPYLSLINKIHASV